MKFFSIFLAVAMSVVTIAVLLDDAVEPDVSAIPKAPEGDALDSSSSDIIIVPRPDLENTTHESDESPFDMANAAGDIIYWNPTIQLRMGGRIQHVGFHYGQKLWDSVYHCLMSLCPTAGGACKRDECRIPGIAYNDRGGVNYSAHVKVQVASSNFPGGIAGDQREALVEAVAGAFMKMSEQAYNCYNLWLSSEIHTMCSVGDQVWVIVWNAQGGGYLNVNLNFNGATLEGAYDCNKGVDDIKRYLGRKTVPKLRKALHQRGFDVDVHCRL